jgi:hypothetical protein
MRIATAAAAAEAAAASLQEASDMVEAVTSA